MNVHSYFPSVTDEWPFQDNLLSTATDSQSCLLADVLSLKRDLNEHAEASSVSPMNGLFKTIFQVQLYLPKMSASQHMFRPPGDLIDYAEVSQHHQTACPTQSFEDNSTDF